MLPSVYAEPQVDNVEFENIEIPSGDKYFVSRIPAGSVRPKRADSAAQCTQIMTEGEKTGCQNR